MGHFDHLFNGDKPYGQFKESIDYYMENGYRVLTEQFLANRGYCCANGCRHCPYEPKAQKGNRVLREDVKKRMSDQ
ncbi:MAG: hypothetical protein CSA36_00295 [Draconibacterium sp.]|nr:MAG: hypothetical protein CSA36_00295 [Draconibacterium sp.]